MWQLLVTSFMKRSPDMPKYKCNYIHDKIQNIDRKAVTKQSKLSTSEMEDLMNTLIHHAHIAVIKYHLYTNQFHIYIIMITWDPAALLYDYTYILSI